MGRWKHVDPITSSRNTIMADGNKYWGGVNNSEFHAEVEALGRGVIPDADPYPTQTGDPDTWPMPTKFKLDGDVFEMEYGCILDGIYQSAEGACTVMVAKAIAEPERGSDVPTGLGHWRDRLKGQGQRPGPNGEIEYWVETETVFIPGINVKSYYNIIKTKSSGTIVLKDKQSFRRLFADILSTGGCEAALDKLLLEIGTLSQPGQELVANSISSLFRNIDGQTGGGGFFINKRVMTDAREQFRTVNSLTEEQTRNRWPGGGGGVTFRDDRKLSERYVYMETREDGGWQPDTYNIPKMQATMAYQDFFRTVHEMFHAAGQTSSYGHEQMEQAARNLGAKSFQRYVEENCFPNMLWSYPQ